MAVRTSISGPIEETREPAQAVSSVKLHVTDPRRVKTTTFAGRLSFLQYPDRGQHGRLAYEEMYKHASVSAPVDFIFALIGSARVAYVAAKDASEREKQMADYLNDQLDRWWVRLLDHGIKPGLFYGFSLAEERVALMPWRDRPMVQVAGIYALPQSTLDDGSVPKEELGEIGTNDPRYRCFDLDTKGDVIAVYQYRDTDIFNAPPTPDGPIKWQGAELANILHFTNDPVQGSPFGKSIMYSAFRHWLDLYDAERGEAQFVALSSRPWLTASYASENPSPDFHEEMKTALEEQAQHRLLVANNTDFGSVSAANSDYTEHIKQYKKGKKTEIAQALLVPEGAFSTTDVNEQNLRDMVALFLKHILGGSIGKNISHFMRWVWGKRLIDANYENVKPHEYPAFRFSITTEEELKTATALVQQLVRYMHTDKLGEFAEGVSPFLRREYFPDEHADSVDAKRPLMDNAQDPRGGRPADSKQSPPDRSGARGDGRDPGGAI